MKTYVPLIGATIALTLAISGCFLAASREINLLVVRTDTGGSEVTVTYRAPPPDNGNVYVLWLVNPDEGKQVKVGSVAPSAQLRAIKTRVDFWATGAVVSIEPTAEVQQMGEDSILVSGQVEKSTPSARAGGR